MSGDPPMQQHSRAPATGRHLAAALFIDMVGFSARMQQDQRGTIRMVDELWAIVRPLIKQYAGAEIDTAGDGMLIEFSAALRAVQCALDTAQTLAQRNQGLPTEQQIRIRASVHLGELEHRDGKIYGDGVNIAARLLPLAPVGAIAVSPHVRDQLLNALEHRIVLLGTRQLKNIRDPMAVYCLPGPECVEDDIAAASYDDVGQSSTRCWHFADAVLDERSLELCVNGRVVELERKPLEVLLHLLRHAGEILTKDEILEAVWPGRVLSDTVLNKAISRIRNVLGDQEQSLIKTQRGYGYRLTAEVTVETHRHEEAQTRLKLSAGDNLKARPHWKLEKQLGAGGHGEVWLARHAKTREERVFKLALQAEHLASLKREITLSRMLHEAYPERNCFIRVLDWNLEDEPYFIECEYSRGGSLLEWAARQGALEQIPLQLRLDIAAQIADALAAAHDIGVLHKDLKPGNVLIDDRVDGTPRVLLADFGSGGVLDQARLDSLDITRMGFTRTMALSSDSSEGTPLYLAPEIFAGQPASAKGDIYALGVMLYQLVIGSFQQTLAPGWDRQLDDPLLVEDIGAASQGNPAGRLGSAADLAHRLRNREQRQAALQAHQQRETELQRAQDLRQQNRRLALIAVATLAFAAVSLSLGGLAFKARNDAVQARLEAERISQFLSQDMLEGLNFDTTNMREVTLRHWLDHASEKVEERFGNDPELAASVYMSLAAAYSNIGQNPSAIALSDRAVALARSAASDGIEIGFLIAEKAEQRMAGVVRFEDLPYWQRVSDAASRQLPENSRRQLAVQLFLLNGLSRFQPERDASEDSARLLEKIRQHQAQDIALLRMAILIHWQYLDWIRNPQRAQALLDEYFELEPPEVARQLSSQVERHAHRGDLLVALNKFAAAEEEFAQGLKLLKQRAHPAAGQIEWFEFEIRDMKVKMAEAGLLEPEVLLPELKNGLAQAQAVFEGHDDNLFGPHFHLAKTLLLARRWSEAEYHARQILAILGRRQHLETSGMQRARLLLAASLRGKGEIAAARKAIDAVRTDRMQLPPSRAEWLWNLGLQFAAEQQTRTALAHLQESQQLYAQVYGAEHYLTRRVDSEMARLNRIE